MRDFPEPVDVNRALQTNGPDIDVPPRETVSIGPFEERYGENFRIAEVRAFADLQTLGLVPRALTEQDAQDALLADDSLFRDRLRIAVEPAHCSCQNGNRNTATSIRRSRSQANLAAALPETYRRSRAEEHPGVIQVYHHLRRFFDKPQRYLVGVVRSNNIIIGFDGVLVMSPSVTVVDANLIDIGEGGRLRFQGSSVSVRCETLNGRSESSPPGPHGPPPGHTPPWPPPIWPPLRSAEDIAARFLPGYSRERRPQGAR